MCNVSHQPSLEPSAQEPRARGDSVQCGGSSLYSSNNEYNITLVTDTHFYYQNRHQKFLPWRACAASITIYHTHFYYTCVYKIYLIFFFYLNNSLYFTPQIAGAPDLRSSVSFYLTWDVECPRCEYIVHDWVWWPCTHNYPFIRCFTCMC